MSITNNYGSYSSITETSSAVAGIAGLFLVIFIISMIISLAIAALMIVSEWIIFKKNNKPGWYSIIPFLNNWTLFELVGVEGWWCLIPVANVVFTYIVSYKLALKYGKSTGFGVVTAIFPFVGYPIIAFSKDSKLNESTVQSNEKDNSQKNNSEEKVQSSLTQFCSQCGSKIEQNADFCSNCGNKLK